VREKELLATSILLIVYVWIANMNALSRSVTSQLGLCLSLVRRPGGK